MTADLAVSTGLAGICVTERGRLTEHERLDWSMRAALLVDAARLGLLTRGAAGPEIHGPATGFGPLDLALTGLEHGMTVDSWIRSGRLAVRDVANVLVARKAWTSRRTGLTRAVRYDTEQPKDQWGRTPVRRLLPPSSASPTDAESAAVLVLTWAAGLEYWGEPVDELLDATGESRWLCEQAWEVIGRERTRDRASLRLGRGAGGQP